MIESLARDIVSALPGDGSAVDRHLDGVHVTVYRCSKLKSVHNGYLGQRERVLTGGVQIYITTDLPTYGPPTVFQARLDGGWTGPMLERRLVTMLAKATERVALDRARDAVQHRLLLIRKPESFEDEWLAHAHAYGLPLLIDIDTMDEVSCGAWLDWLSTRR